jgi:hypothetical protein
MPSKTGKELPEFPCMTIFVVLCWSAWGRHSFSSELVELSAHYHFGARPQVRAGNRSDASRAIRYTESFLAARPFTTLKNSTAILLSGEIGRTAGPGLAAIIAQ